MTRNATRPVTTRLLEYVRRVSLRESDAAAGLRTATGELKERGWECAPEQGQLLALLIEMIDAHTVLEVGTFTGYGTLWMAEALPDDGRLVTCDMMEEYVGIGRPFWAQADVAHKIDVLIGPADESLEQLINGGNEDSFDLAYVDANKKDYDGYYEAALRLVRPGGVIALDNMFWNGAVLDPDDDRKSTVTLKALNEKLGQDKRISMTMLPLDDGLTVCVKRRA